MAYVQTLEDDKDKQQTGDAGAPTVQTNAGQSVSVGGTASTQNGAKASSGRFTNIQKYLGANKGAGEQIAGNVAGQLDKNVQQQRTGAEDTQKAVTTGIGEANTTLQRGQGYQNDLGSDNPFAVANSSFATKPVAAQSLNSMDAKQDQTGTVFDSNMGGKFQSFANDTNKLTDLTKFRYGQNVDEDKLKQQGLDAQTAAGTFQNQAQTEADRTKDEAGRFGLVKQTFARPNYTAGQQRLDNVFFGTSGKAGIGAVQNKAVQNINQAQQFGQDAASNANQVTDIAGREAALSGQLNTTTSGLKSAFMDMLNKRIDPTKQAYGNEVDRYAQNIGLLTRTPTNTKSDKAIDQNIWDETGLRGGEQTFNSLTGKRLDELADVNDLRNKTLTAQDVSQQGDVDTLKALNALSQSSIDENGNLAKNYTDEFNTAGNLGRAVTLKQGDQGILGRINTATRNFLANAAGTNITGTGTDTYSGGLFGGGGRETRTATANIGDLLNNSGYAAAMNGTPGRDQFNDIGQNVTNYYSPLNGVLNGATGINLAGMAGSMLSSVGGALTGTGDQQGGAQRAASVRAQQDLQNQLAQYFKDQGFNTAVTRNGTVDASDNITAQRNAQMEQNNLVQSLQAQTNMYGIDANSTPDQIRQAALDAANKNQQYTTTNVRGETVFHQRKPEEIAQLAKDYENMWGGYNGAEVKRLTDAQTQQQQLINNLLGTTGNFNPGQTVNTQVERGSGPAMTLEQVLAATSGERVRHGN